MQSLKYKKANTRILYLTRKKNKKANTSRKVFKSIIYQTLLHLLLSIPSSYCSPSPPDSLSSTIPFATC
uniref:Uncharacterized protein n=1 Tax=Manihot esculenta TaxID=3983 RepID=A0A2C9VEK2_MANES